MSKKHRNQHAGQKSASAKDDATGSVPKAQEPQGLLELEIKADIPTFLSLLIGAFFILAPLKLGTSLNLTPVPVCPLSLDEWIFGLWPPLVLPVLGGGLLILVVILEKPCATALKACWPVWTAPLALALASLFGQIGTTEVEYAQDFLWQAIGLSALAFAVMLHLHAVPSSRGFLLGCIATGAVLVMGAGLYQRFIGFEETRIKLEEQIANGTATFDPAIMDRLNQGRIFATFTYPNALAGYLLLVIPVLGVLAWRLGRKTDTPELGGSVMLALTLVIGTIVLLMTGSRAALVAYVLGGVATALIAFLLHSESLRKHALKIGIAAAVIITLAIPTFLLVQGDRSLSSLQARGDYYRSALVMFQQHPVTGAGLGEFFGWHTRYKPPTTEDTRLPHSIFFNFLSQCGLPGALLALFFMCSCPIIAWWKMSRGQIVSGDPILWVGIAAGWLAWTAHALVDFNVQIPGGVAILVVLPVLGINWKKTGELHQTRRKPAPRDKPDSKGESNHDVMVRVACVLLAILSMVHIRRFSGERAYEEFYRQRVEFGSLKEMEREARAVARVKPHSPYAWDFLGRAALLAGDYTLAEEAFTHAAEATPHRAAFHFRLGYTQALAGKTEAALASAEIAETWNPSRNEYRMLKVALTKGIPVEELMDPTGRLLEGADEKFGLQEKVP